MPQTATSSLSGEVRAVAPAMALEGLQTRLECLTAVLPTRNTGGGIPDCWCGAGLKDAWRRQ